MYYIFIHSQLPVAVQRIIDFDHLSNYVCSTLLGWVDSCWNDWDDWPLLPNSER